MDGMLDGGTNADGISYVGAEVEGTSEGLAKER